VNKLRTPLTEKFKFFYPQNGIIYSPECLNEDLILQTDEEGRHYEMAITLGGILEIGQDKESLNFFGRFFKILQHKLKLQQIGRKYFDPKEGTSFKDLRLEVWPGFSTSLNNYGSNFLVNIDTSYKILREDSAFDVIQDIRRVNTDNNQIETALTNTTVMTKYNKRMYRITGVDFSQSPLSSFETSQGISKTFVDYYLEKYNIKISDCKQPLLIHTDRKSSRKLYLIPELCSVTGLSDAQRNDFNLMKKLAQITKPDAQKRLGEAGKLIDLFYKNPETKSLMENWNIKISKDCEQVFGFFLLLLISI
jgi:aubergine